MSISVTVGITGHLYTELMGFIRNHHNVNVSEHPMSLDQVNL